MAAVVAPGTNPFSLLTAAIWPEALAFFSALSNCLILASFNLLSVVSAAAISFVISPFNIAASICRLISADLSKFLDIACIILFCKLPDLIEPLRSAPSSDTILLASINES